MALETATYISELNQNNPVGSSDTVSTLDDHDRLIKKTILNTFGGFVGTAGSPKSVTLTEDEINDAAQKSATQTVSGTWDFTGDPTLDSIEAGWKTIPVLVDDNARTFVLTDSGRCLQKDAGAAAIFTIPANAATAFPVGTVIQIRNRDNSDITLTITTDTLRLAVEGTTNDVTIPQYSECVIEKVATTEWWVSGAGIS